MTNYPTPRFDYAAAKLGLMVGTRADAAAQSLPGFATAIRTNGYSTPGVGAATYIRASALPPFNGGFQDAAGGFWEISEPEIDVLMFGAPNDADPVAFTGTSATAAINNAIAYVNSIGGGDVCLPTGYYLVTVSLGANGIVVLSDVNFRGTGGWLLRANNTVAHVVTATSVTNAKILNLNIDGNSANNPITPGTHGIRVNSCSDMTTSGNYIKNATAYSISHDKTHRQKVLSNTIVDSGADGIDFHNLGVGTDLAEYGSIVAHNIVNGFGLLSDDTKAGIHGRGAGLIIANNLVYGIGSATPGAQGIIAGNGESVNGQQVLGNYIELGSGGVTVVGITTNNPNSTIANNTILCTSAVQDAIIVAQSNTIVTGNNVSGGNARDGIVLAIEAIDSIVTGNSLQSCGRDGIRDKSTGTRYAGNHAKDCIAFAYNCALSTNAYLDPSNTQSGCAGLFSTGTNSVFDQQVGSSSSPTFSGLIIGPTVVPGVGVFQSNVRVDQSITGNPKIGSSTNDPADPATNLFVYAANGGGINFGTSSTGTVQFAVKHTASADTYMTVTGSTGDVALGVSTTGATNSSVSISGKGTGGGKLRDGGAAIKLQWNTTGLGFFAATPVARQTAPAALPVDGSATNADICTAVNALRTIGINFGWSA